MLAGQPAAHQTVFSAMHPVPRPRATILAICRDTRAHGHSPLLESLNHALAAVDAEDEGCVTGEGLSQKPCPAAIV